MKIRLKPVAEQVIVVTGASSGIGLATAQAAAARGAKVVLAARSEAALATAVAGIEQDGGEALAVVADVGSRDDVARIADRAVARFGRIDTWVNNAGVDLWGRVEETPDDDMRRLFETNFWGTVHGARVALPHLKARGGALINVGSLESDRAVPLQAIYSASKHAVKGLTDALRAELMHERAPVSVTLIKPASIGTPIPQHVRNHTGREAKLPPPIYAPEDVADTILYAAAHPLRDAFVGSAGPIGSIGAQLLPGLTDWISARFLVDLQRGDRPASGVDNLHHGLAEAQVRGDHEGSTIRRSVYTRTVLHPVATAATIGFTLVGLAALVAGSRVGRLRR